MTTSAQEQLVPHFLDKAISISGALSELQRVTLGTLRPTNPVPVGTDEKNVALPGAIAH